jgi:hypothetical protein
MMVVTRGSLFIGQERTQGSACVLIGVWGPTHMPVIVLDEGECGFSLDWRRVMIDRQDGCRELLRVACCRTVLCFTFLRVVAHRVSSFVS